MATARIFHFTEEELNSAGGGAYAEFDVPCEAPVRLVKVEDYDKRDAGKSWGWVFHYNATTPISGKEVSFRMWLSFMDNARWKLLEVLDAHGVDLDKTTGVDPEDLIGDELIGLIDFPRDRETGEPTSEFRELRKVYPVTITRPASVSEELPSEVEEEEAPTDEEPEIL